jgi:hypothetical protein
MSVDPDDLARHALRSALQESGVVPDRGLASLALARGAATDEALTDADSAIWEQTINTSLEAGGIDATRGPSFLRDADDDIDEGAELSEDEPARNVDLTHDNIRDASLFDSEGDEGDDTREPEVHADNTTPEHARDSGFVPAYSERREQISARQQPAYKASTRTRRRRSSTMG